MRKAVIPFSIITTIVTTVLATSALHSAAPSQKPLQANGQTPFLSPHSHPIEVTPDAVYVANTPSGTLDIINPKTNRVIKSIDVGIEPVSVKLRPDGRELWVSNHVSDSVSVIKLEPGHPLHQTVIATIQDIDSTTGATRFDEPCGIAFASNEKAYIALSSENKIAVIDIRTRAINKYITIPAQDPRNLCVKGETLYVTAFESGNQTQLSGGVKPLGGELATFDAYDHSIINNNVLSLGHKVDIIKNPAVPDRDLFTFSTKNEALTSVTSSIGTLLYGLDILDDGRVVVAQTDARNDANGKAGTKRHGLKELENRPFFNRITLVDTNAKSQSDKVRHIELEPKLPAQPTQTTALATPSAIASVKGTPYVIATAAGSDAIFTLDTRTSKVISRIAAGANPDGIATQPDGNGHSVYVLNAVDNSVSVGRCDNRGTLTAQAVIPLNDPTSTRYKLGRKAFSTAKASSNGTFSCASCHPDGHTDQLLWVLDTPIVGGGNQIMPRSTMPTRGLQDTMPFHWDGIPGDPYGGINSANLTRNVQPNSDPLRPATATRHLIDAGLASTMRADTDNYKNDEGKSGHLSSSERTAMAEFLLAIRYPPAQRRPFTNTVTSQAMRGFELFHVLGDNDPGKSEPNVCGDCHRMPFLVSTNTPGSGMDAPTWRGAYDRWLILPQGRMNMVVFDFYRFIADMGAPEQAIWGITWGGRERFNPVWNMVTEGSTGFSGTFGRQVTIGGTPTPLDTAMITALEQGAADGAVILKVTGKVPGKSIQTPLTFENGLYTDATGRRVNRQAFIKLIQQNNGVATFTGHSASRIAADTPQPAVWSPGPLQIQRGHQVFPLLFPENLQFTVSVRNVQQGAAVFLDGRRVGAKVTLSGAAATIALSVLPSTGWHLIQLQNPSGLFSNDFLVRAAPDAKSGGVNLRDALLRGDDRLAQTLLINGAPINEPGDEGSTAVHVAAFFGRTDRLQYMLDHGADVNKRNRSGQRPIDVVSGPMDNGLADFYSAIGDANGVQYDRTTLVAARMRNATLLRK